MIIQKENKQNQNQQKQNKTKMIITGWNFTEFGGVVFSTNDMDLPI